MHFVCRTLTHLNFITSVVLDNNMNILPFYQWHLTNKPSFLLTYGSLWCVPGFHSVKVCFCLSVLFHWSVYSWIVFIKTLEEISGYLSEKISLPSASSSNLSSPSLVLYYSIWRNNPPYQVPWENTAKILMKFYLIYWLFYRRTEHLKLSFYIHDVAFQLVKSLSIALNKILLVSHLRCPTSLLYLFLNTLVFYCYCERCVFSITFSN